jgi:hypothetical protein
MDRYVKEVSTGKILISMETDSFPVANAESFVTSRGWNLSDYEIGEKTSDDLDALRLSSRTSTEVWEEDMGNFKLSRETEDLITAGSLTMNEYQKTIYDAKIKRRSEKP